MTLILALVAVAAAPAVQGMDPVWVGQSAIGQSNMSNARANTRRVAGEPDRSSASARESVDVSTCRSSMTQARLESTYRGRVMLQGRAKADAWLREECGTSADAVAASATGKPAAAPRRTDERGEKNGEGCRMVMRPIPNVGGGAMSMGMVPDCD